uniref:NDH-dependent cyclic electron flow 5 n=1 Tax=Kalanchoe fedtschenkoi TaxID=63787 RepID=A0A7N0VJZ9_KALFE
MKTAVKMMNALLPSPHIKSTLVSPHQSRHSFPPHISFTNNNLTKGRSSLAAIQLQPPCVASIPFQPTNDEAYLQAEFGGRGVTFDPIGDIDGRRSSVVKMELDNGTMAAMMLPAALVTSFKVPMWHGETLEMLHTQVSEGVDGQGAVIRGGVSLDMRLQTDDGFWSTSTWRLVDVRGSSDTSIKVELVSCDVKGAIEVRHILKLQEDTLSSELVVSNSGSSKLQFMGSFISHLTVSTPDATYAVGLEGSDFVDMPPLRSNFSFFPPDMNMELDLNESSTNHHKANYEGATEKGRIGEENDSYKHLTDKLSRIYNYAPSAFTVIDRGRRNSLIVGRKGFDELYLFSPGSEHEFYSKYAYVCVGQSAMLKPVTVGCEETWRGAQSLRNPSLE